MQRVRGGPARGGERCGGVRQLRAGHMGAIGSDGMCVRRKSLASAYVSVTFPACLKTWAGQVYITRPQARVGSPPYTVHGPSGFEFECLAFVILPAGLLAARPADRGYAVIAPGGALLPWGSIAAGLDA